MWFRGQVLTACVIITYVAELSLAAQCVCAVNGPLSVHRQANSASTNIGTIQVKRCVPFLYPIDGNFTAILFNMQIGFVHVSVDQISLLDNCTGNHCLSQTSQPHTTPRLVTKSEITSTASTTSRSSTVTVSMTSGLNFQPRCPSDWIIYGTSCYLLQTNSRRHWSDANSDCVSRNSHLAIIETADEFSFLKHRLVNRINTHTGDHSDSAVWVAGTDHNREGSWEWYDGSTHTYSPLKYSAWDHDEPDAGEGEHEEDCMTMIGNRDFKWSDYSCHANMFYVCEQSALCVNCTVQLAHQTNAANCPPGWIQNHGSCYLFHTNSRYTWRDANSLCSSHQAHLAIIETAEEDQFLHQQSSQRILYDGSNSNSGVWVAGSDDDHEGRWEWIYGLSHTSKPIGYSNWHPGEPDSGDGDHDEDCMCLIGTKGFQWQDRSCSSHMYFVCEKTNSLTAPLVG